MTHVWQTQTRGRFYLPLMRHPFCRYAYDLVPGRPFARYGLEQQAELVRHAFLAKHGVMRQRRSRAVAASFRLRNDCHKSATGVARSERRRHSLSGERRFDTLPSIRI